MLHSLLDSRVEVDSAAFKGLGSVTDACAVFCLSNSCRQWALLNKRPRIVAKIVGILADGPRYVLLTQPRLKGAPHSRRESTSNRTESGLVPFVLNEPGAVECSYCPKVSGGRVSLGLTRLGS
jgi:hypothetical protein